MNERATAALMRLEVTNHNDFTIDDMFDGVPVKFPPNTPVNCTEAQALHFFGWPGELADRAIHMARRFGWSGKDYLKPEGPTDSVPRYVTLSEKIVITPVYYDLVKRDPNAPIPVDTGDEESDRPVSTAPESTTRSGRKRRVGRPPKGDRHRTEERGGVRLGSR